MKGKMKKILALALATVMLLAMGMTAMAQEVGAEKDDTATITIKNASKGEKYTVYKLFDATVSADGSSIYYTLMDGKENANPYFKVNDGGYVEAEEATDSETLKSQNFKDWVADYGKMVHEMVEADGSELVFQGLDYGYYYVASTQGANVTVTSTNPTAEIYDKNAKSPNIPEGGLKNASEENVSIGDTVTYEIAFNTTNYIGEGEAAKKVISYTIKDTLPETFLDDVKVTSIKVMNGEEELANITKQFDDNKQITIDWVVGEGENKGDSLYKNGAKIVITYTAKVIETAQIAGEGNKNDVTVTWTTEDGATTPEGSELRESETIFTYAIALKKVDDKGKNLPGAEFSVAGLAVKGTDGNYIVTTSDDTNKITGNLKCDANGELVIKGVKAGSYTVTEEVAPDGYNKLTAPITVEATKLTGETTNTIKYLNEKGEVVDTESETKVTYENNEVAASAHFIVNMTGTVLPSTGGIGTTIFYVVGGILVLGACVLLVTKKRMSARD